MSGSGSGGSVPPPSPEALSGAAAHPPAPSAGNHVEAPAAWRWRYGDAEGRDVETPAQPSPVFTSQADAESWVGEFWRDLVADGVDTVTLQVDGRTVYGPMSLHPVAE